MDAYRVEKIIPRLARMRKQTAKGPWKWEPDRVDFRHAGFPCFIKRNQMLAWCGYVGVPKGHPLFGKHYNDIRGENVHGGLTYSDGCQGELCHVPLAGEDDHVWWLGFDCAHSDDVVPTLKHMWDEFFGGISPWMFHSRPTYKRMQYVERETRFLAEQLSKVNLKHLGENLWSIDSTMTICSTTRKRWMKKKRKTRMKKRKRTKKTMTRAALAS